MEFQKNTSCSRFIIITVKCKGYFATYTFFFQTFAPKINIIYKVNRIKNTSECFSSSMDLGLIQLNSHQVKASLLEVNETINQLSKNYIMMAFENLLWCFILFTSLWK